MIYNENYQLDRSQLGTEIVELCASLNVSHISVNDSQHFFLIETFKKKINFDFFKIYTFLKILTFIDNFIFFENFDLKKKLPFF